MRLRKNEEKQFLPKKQLFSVDKDFAGGIIITEIFSDLLNYFSWRIIMKKILVTLMVAAMIAVMCVPTLAAEPVTISGGFWTAWTPGYEVVADAPVKLEMDVKGGADNWNNFFAVLVNGPTTGTAAPADEVEGYLEYAVLRADDYGWGTYYNVGDGSTVFTSDIVDANEDGDKWDDFRGVYADAHVDVTIEKTETGVLLTYVVTGANGVTFTHTAAQTLPAEATPVYVFFGCDGSEVTVSEAAAEAEGEGAPEEEAPQTGFATVALAAAALLSGAYIAKKKH